MKGKIAFNAYYVIVGPCQGMDCWHGVFMHSDGKQGEDHKIEDKVLMEENLLEVQGKTSGPCEGMDCLHGVMMHGDDKPGQEHKHEKLGPEEKPQSDGPCVGMDCLHGVMMHGDDHTGKDHEKDHEKENQKQEAEKNDKQADGPCVGMDCLHGVMMHGDEKEGVKHDIEDAEKSKHAHGDHGIPGGPEDKAGPCVGMDCLHGVLMHNDEKQGDEHNHEKAGPEDAPKESGPCVGMDCLHGVMMHSDEKQGKGHDGDHEKLHPKTEPLKDPVGPLDPDNLIHDHSDKPHTIAEPADKDEYLRWKSGNQESENSFLGFSFPYVSDTIFDNIEILKQRYLPRFWGTSDSSSKASAGKEKGNTVIQHKPKTGNNDAGVNKETKDTEPHFHPKRTTIKPTTDNGDRTEM